MANGLPECPLCGSDGHRKDTPGELYHCFKESCRVVEFRP